MWTRTSCVLAACCAISAPGFAQVPLSEADALARLSPDSPRVRAIQAEADVARAGVAAASRFPNPRVTYDREAVGGVAESMVTVAQPLPVTGRRGLEIQAAQSLVDASVHRAADAMRLARAELRQAFAALISAQIREAEWIRARDRLSELANVLASREAAGDASGYERLRAEREVMELGLEVAAARGDRARAQASLAAFFPAGTDAGVLVAVAPPTIPSREPLPAAQDLALHAQETRGEGEALAREIESATFAERAADRSVIPEPEVFGGTKSTNAAGGPRGGVFGLQLAIPLFDRGQPERAAAEARRRRAEAQLVSFRTSLAAEVSALRALVTERRAAADQYRRTSTENATALERIAQVSYDAVERGILELLDAYRSGATARARQAELDAAVRDAEIQLEYVSGWEVK